MIARPSGFITTDGSRSSRLPFVRFMPATPEIQTRQREIKLEAASRPQAAQELPKVAGGAAICRLSLFGQSAHRLHIEFGALESLQFAIDQTIELRPAATRGTPCQRMARRLATCVLDRFQNAELGDFP